MDISELKDEWMSWYAHREHSLFFDMTNGISDDQFKGFVTRLFGGLEFKLKDDLDCKRFLRYFLEKWLDFDDAFLLSLKINDYNFRMIANYCIRDVVSDGICEFQEGFIERHKEHIVKLLNESGIKAMERTLVDAKERQKNKIYHYTELI